MKTTFLTAFIICLLALSACSTVHQSLSTESISAVDNFELEKYLGKWYEIARFNHKFERYLDNVTATYSIDEDGDLYVLNRGYNTKNEEWEEAEGKGKIPDIQKPAELRVSFFLFFYSDYKIIALDEDYQWAVVTTNSKEHLWILSRKPVMEDEIYGRLLKFTKEQGFMSNLLIKVKQDKNIETVEDVK